MDGIALTFEVEMGGMELSFGVEMLSFVVGMELSFLVEMDGTALSFRL